MGRTSDTRRLLAISIPVVTFGLVFFVMHAHERAKPPVVYKSRIGVDRLAHLTPEQLAQEIAAEWIKDHVGPEALLHDVTVSLEPGGSGELIPLKATIAGRLASSGLSKQVSLDVSVDLKDGQIVFQVHDWSLE